MDVELGRYKGRDCLETYEQAKTAVESSEQQKARENLETGLSKARELLME